MKRYGCPWDALGMPYGSWGMGDLGPRLAGQPPLRAWFVPYLRSDLPSLLIEEGCMLSHLP